MSDKRCSVAGLSLRPLAILLLCSLVSIAARNARADAQPQSLADMVARVSPAVVRVITIRPPAQDAGKSADKAMVAAASKEPSTATGSGFIVDPLGYIATNKHVVKGAISVFVVTADSVRYPAAIVGMAKNADMALLRIDVGHALPFAKFGNSDKMRPGDRVVAIGSPFGFDTSVTTGVVSAIDRNIMESPFDDYIQTDAAINHGNSGGPLFNLAGEVIGMTSVIFAPGRGSAGVGFALPSNNLQFVFDRLMATGAIDAGMLPLLTQQVTWLLQQGLDLPDRQGALVVSVQDHGDAMLHGKIKPADVIRTFNGQKVMDPRELARQAAQAAIGSDAVLSIYRGGAEETVHVRIQALPEAKPVVLDNNGPRTLGLELATGPGESETPDVMVASVNPAGTAAASGIRKGDRIIEVGQTVVSDPAHALRILQIRSAMGHRFAAVLLDREHEKFWMSLEIP